DLAGNLTTLYRFTNSPRDGGFSVAGLIQARDGHLYGTTGGDGINDFGTVFRMDLAGNLATLHSFATPPSDGARPYASLLHATDDNFYGTTSHGGGALGSGTIFRMNSVGNLTTIVRFGHVHGSEPYAGLIQARDGDFYGTTRGGGTLGRGTVFRIDSSGNLTTLHSFTDFPDDGSAPNAALIQATDGNFYGTTTLGGQKAGSSKYCRAGCGA